MLKLKYFASHEHKQAFANIVWLKLERIIQIVVAIIISSLLARYFGPDVFGKWQYANTLLLVFTPITWVCGAEILVPIIVNCPSTELGTVLGSAFTLRIMVSALALLAIWGGIVAGLFNDPLVGAMLISLAVTMFFRESFIGLINLWLQSMTCSRPQLIISMAMAILKAVFVWKFVHVAARPSCFGWLWALESAIIGIVLLYYFWKRHGSKLSWHIDRTLFQHFAMSGIVFWLALICMYLFLKLDRLMLESTISFAEFSRYSAAQQLNENWIALAWMLAQTIAPVFVYRVQCVKQLRRNMRYLFSLTALLMFVGALVLYLLAAFIITCVFGSIYADATNIFRWAVWLSVPAGIEAIGNLVLLKYQAKFILLMKWLLALALAFAVNLLTITRMGTYGALMGLATGYLAAAIVNFYYIRFKLHS